MNAAPFFPTNDRVYENPKLKIHIQDNAMDSDSFDVRVTLSGESLLNENWSLLNMDPDSDRYVVTWMNGRSRLVEVEDLESTNPAPGNYPAVDSLGTPLTGGDNGDPLTDADWIGDAAARTGFHAMERAYEPIHVMAPGTSSTSQP